MSSLFSLIKFSATFLSFSSTEEILLDIYSPNYPDLQFVDLPGFTRTTVAGQNEGIVQLIEELNLKYMRDPNTIILAIQDGTQDIANSEALNKALSVDPEGKRTVGVLTKLDLLQRSVDKEKVAKVLENKTKPLQLGYFGVVSDTDLSHSNTTLMTDPAFQAARGTDRLGIDSLRRFITHLLANKVEKLIPGLEQQSREELLRVENLLRENGRFDDANIDYDDIIAKLVEEAIARIKISLDGLSNRVDIKEIAAGASLNEKIKAGVIEASKTARQTYKVEEFHDQLVKAKRNVHGIRDNLLPQELVLEIGVSLLTETYREPMKKLLQDSYELLTSSIQTILKDTLGIYEKFEELVMDLILAEIGKNKMKAEEYLDHQIDIHKKFVNSEHEEFKKSKLLKKNGGIRYKNNFNLWFQEGITNDKQNNEENGDDDDDDDDGVLEVINRAADVTLGSFGSKLVNLGVGKVRGFVERLQERKEEDGDVHFNKLPTGAGEEAQLHLDLCLQYMEIVDKALVDEIPKTYIMMLVFRTLDFLAGGNSYETSLLRKVQKECQGQDGQKKKEVLEKSFAHEEMIRNLKERQRVCTGTISVIQETRHKLKNIKQKKSV